MKGYLKKHVSKLLYVAVGAAAGFGTSKTDLIPFDKGKSIASTQPPIQTTYPICRDAYNLNYNGSTRTAHWVYERLTKDDLEKKCSRKNCEFAEDTCIPEVVRSLLSDYRKSGFDRGHLCPAGDRTFDCKVMQETFYLSNMSPQTHPFNAGIWAKLEQYVRDLTKKYDVVHVFSIPLYLPKEEEDGRYVRYQVIGQNDVAVPTHFAKVIFAGSDTLAFLIPHDGSISPKTSLDEFKTNLTAIEKASGFVFEKAAPR